jgi:hypothetical protein
MRILGLQNAGVIPMKRHPVSCPVCGRPTVKPLLRDVQITAEMDGVVSDVHALGAFRCEEEGHIFFVRASDLESAGTFRAGAA